MKDIIIYTGWIGALQSDKGNLEILGIKVGWYNESESCFEDCELTKEAYDKLDPLWGKYVWGLYCKRDRSNG